MRVERRSRGNGPAQRRLGVLLLLKRAGKNSERHARYLAVAKPKLVFLMYVLGWVSLSRVYINRGSRTRHST